LGTLDPALEGRLGGKGKGELGLGRTGTSLSTANKTHQTYSSLFHYDKDKQMSSSSLTSPYLTLPLG